RRSWLGERAEDDRVGRARLLARGAHLVGAQGATVGGGGDLRLADALHAKRALLHHATLAYRHVGILSHDLRGRERGVVVEPIKSANLVRTVVGAEARAHAP